MARRRRIQSLDLGEAVSFETVLTILTVLLVLRVVFLVPMVNIDKAKTESARKDTEDAYTRELKERLSAIGEQYRAQTARLEEQIASVENALATI